MLLKDESFVTSQGRSAERKHGRTGIPGPNLGIYLLVIHRRDCASGKLDTNRRPAFSIEYSLLTNEPREHCGYEIRKKKKKPKKRVMPERWGDRTGSTLRMHQLSATRSAPRSAPVSTAPASVRWPFPPKRFLGNSFVPAASGSLDLDNGDGRVIAIDDFNGDHLCAPFVCWRIYKCTAILPLVS
jgi:hypothetical protein